MIMKKLRAALLLSAVLTLLLPVSGCGGNNETAAGKGVKIHPDAPGLSEYDVILMGENHISAQIFDIELSMMQYYYSLGVRDFAFECSFGEALFLKYYYDTGDEQCYEYLNRYSASENITQFSHEKAAFHKKIHLWNSGLEEKIQVHGFDIEHDPYGTGIAATWFFILNKYGQTEGMPLFSTNGIWPRAGNWYRFIEDFRTNPGRYAHISIEDIELIKKIVANIEQGLIANNWNYNVSDSENRMESAILREHFMTENFRETVKSLQGRKLFAILGYMHTDLTGKAAHMKNESQFPWITTSEPCLANVLKDEIRIASVVMRSFGNTSKWPYFIRINGWELAKPRSSAYRGKWPYE